jgi:type IX secretion system substrate protein
MKTTILFFFLLTLFTSQHIQLYCQIFQLTEDETDKYIIDRFTDEIYYEEFVFGTQRKINFHTRTVTNSVLLALPEFANNSHKAAYVFDRNLYLYDFTEDSTYLLADLRNLHSTRNVSNIFNGLYFSAADSYLLVTGGDETHYYSFADSSFLSLGFLIFEGNPQWSSDTTLLFVNLENEILEHNFITKETKNILSTPFPPILSFAYNPLENLIAYTICLPEPSLHLYNLETEVDTIIYNLDSVECNTAPFCFLYLNWDSSFKKLAFFLTGSINSHTGINYYDIDSSRFFKLIDCFDSDYLGLKYYLEWINKSTLSFIWFDSDRQLIYLAGIDISGTLDIKNNYEVRSKDYFISQNYPNPFNPSTTIEFNLSKGEEITLTVYDMLGRKVAILHKGYLKTGNHKVQWEAEGLASGLYICKLQTGGFTKSIKMLLAK